MNAHPDKPRGFALAQVARPTETRGLRRAAQNPTPTPDMAALFDRVLTAHATGDAHGLSLFGHAIARLAESEASTQQNGFAA